MANPNGCELSVVTPMYNEADRIQEDIGKIIESLKRLNINYEYILVDDGSTDDSYIKAKAVLADLPQCRIIHYKRNRGRGFALRKGLSNARGKYIITTESDLSWGVEIIGKLYTELIETGSDMVVASVYLPGGGLENVPVFRRLLSRYGNKFMRLAFGGNLTMLSGMTRGYKRELIQLLHLEEDGKEIHLEIIMKAQLKNFHITEIPAVIRWRPGTSRGSRFGNLQFIIPHIFVSFQRAAVRAFFCGAGIASFLGITLVIFGTINKLFSITPRPLPYLVAYGLTFCVLALLCLLFGVISIQISYVYRSLVHIQTQQKELKMKSELPSDESS